MVHVFEINSFYTALHNYATHNGSRIYLVEMSSNRNYSDLIFPLITNLNTSIPNLNEYRTRITNLNTSKLAQLLSHCYRCGRCGTRIPGRSNRTQRRQRLAIAAMFLRNCVAQTLSCGDVPVTRYALRRNSASIMKILIFFTNLSPKARLYTVQYTLKYLQVYFFINFN